MKNMTYWLEQRPKFMVSQIGPRLFLYDPQAKNGSYIFKGFFLSMQQRPHVACKA